MHWTLNTMITNELSDFSTSKRALQSSHRESLTRRITAGYHESQNSTPLLSTGQDNNVLLPIWSCSTDQSHRHRQQTQRDKHKLVFVHVFKTAGMTMRELFLRYAVACHAGIGLLSECSGLSPDSIRSNSTAGKWWTNGFGSKKGKPCLIKAVNRAQLGLNALDTIKMQNSILSELDILGGHLPLGVGAAWNQPTDQIAFAGNPQTTSIQYVTFFRDAVSKFISGVLYQKRNRNYSFRDILNLIRSRVQGELAQGKYREGYSAYLLTPEQKQYFYGSKFSTNNSTIADRTRQILDNLNHHNILVGIVERMSESLELLQFVLDRDNEQTPLFESFGMQNKNQTAHIRNREETAAKINNPSKFSTASVVVELQQDPTFFSMLQEYVKYDAMIYDKAFRRHELQYDFVVKQKRGALAAQR